MGIPTVYNGVKFRSRLEAKWACIFDMLKWPWDYEPFDLENYIPDFVLAFEKPLLVEIKPDTQIDTLKSHYPKIRDSGWDKNSIILGSRYFTESPAFMGIPIGLFFANDGFISSAVPFLCRKCQKISIFAAEGSWDCLRCGHYDGLNNIQPSNIDFGALYKKAGNEVQWKKSV